MVLETTEAALLPESNVKETPTRKSKESPTDRFDFSVREKEGQTMNCLKERRWTSRMRRGNEDRFLSQKTLAFTRFMPFSLLIWLASSCSTLDVDPCQSASWPSSCFSCNKNRSCEKDTRSRNDGDMRGNCAIDSPTFFSVRQRILFPVSLHSFLLCC